MNTPHNCDVCKQQMAAAIYDELPPNERLAFDNMLNACSSCAEEYRQLQALMQVLPPYILPAKSSVSSEKDVNEKNIESFVVRTQERLNAALAQASHTQGSSTIQSSAPIARAQDRVSARSAHRSVYQLFSGNSSFNKMFNTTILKAAAILICGVFLGRVWFSVQSAQNKVAQNTSTDESHSFAQHTAFSRDVREMSRQEVQDFLQESHLLLLSVMTINAECGVANPRALLSQQEQCVNLLNKAQQIKAEHLVNNSRFSEAQQARLLHLLGNVEYALAEVAALQTASNNTSEHILHIKHVQSGADYALCEISSALQEEARR